MEQFELDIPYDYNVDADIILNRALRLIEKPESWCQDMQARDREGSPISPNSPKAVQWCAVGAIRRASTEAFRLTPILDISDHLLLQKLNNMCGGSLASYNDTHSHEEVLETLREARSDRHKRWLKERE